jgi:hypothetical protein
MKSRKLKRALDPAGLRGEWIIFARWPGGPEIPLGGGTEGEFAECFKEALNYCRDCPESRVFLEWRAIDA